MVNAEEEMLKYVITATALKMFSTSSQTKQMYRFLGNTFGQRRRIHEGLNSTYLDRAKKILELCKKHSGIQNGDKLLEIGTGWLHWESTIIRLFYEVEITLFDVWDNRQLGAYKQYFGQLEEVIDKELDMDSIQHKRAHDLLRVISQASSFDDIYKWLGFRYVINPSGTLKQFQDESFAVIFSSNVLEHIEISTLPEFVHDFHRLLNPGGYSFHQIDLGDHLAYYDKGVSLKNYLRYPNKVWKRYFENDIQYFNLVQRPAWLTFFQKAGFEALEEESVLIDISLIKVDRSYCHMSEQDLQCRTLRVVHRKPHE
jgi:cyclopropane fatty-acyl-phospholipid synthase-like methyltransferase